MRAILFVFLILFSLRSVAEEPASAAAAALLQALHAEGLLGAEPVLAESSGDVSAPPSYFAALVEKPASVMRLMLVRRDRNGHHEVVARSAPIGGLRGSNFGFGIELFRFNAPDRLELVLSARAACARALYTHRFALRQGRWQVTGLDVEMPRCAAGGIEVDWTESANYLSGKTHRTTFTRTGTSRATSSPAARYPFMLADFPPPGPEGVYREMQP